VYAAFPSVNDPFGTCFSVPATRACTRAKADAWLSVDVLLLFRGRTIAVMANRPDVIAGALAGGCIGVLASASPPLRLGRPSDLMGANAVEGCS
jgi:hypothetical protein